MASIYDEIGGAQAVAAAVEDFYVRVLGDPVLAPYFTHTDMRRLKSHMRAFLATAIGGPEIYAGRDMGAAHAHLNATHEAFDHVVEHLVATLEGLDVPTSYIEAIGAKLAPLRAVVVNEERLAA
jgi:hemoglobin